MTQTWQQEVIDKGIQYATVHLEFDIRFIDPICGQPFNTPIPAAKRPCFVLLHGAQAYLRVRSSTVTVTAADWHIIRTLQIPLRACGPAYCSNKALSSPRGFQARCQLCSFNLPPQLPSPLTASKSLLHPSSVVAMILLVLKASGSRVGLLVTSVTRQVESCLAFCEDQRCDVAR